MPKTKTVTIDYSKKYGKLTPISETRRTRGSCTDRMILCRCDCGNEKLVRVYSLVSGATKSCGCTALKHASEKVPLHRHGLRYSRLYHIWVDMKQRCYNPCHAAYKRYGGAGITVCDEWKSDPSKFFEWAKKNGYNEKLTVDRIDNEKGYCPENCRLASMKEQARNRRNTKRFSYNGSEKTLPEWAEETGIPYQILIKRINAGWPLQKAICTPPMMSGKRKDGMSRKKKDRTEVRK